MGDDDNEATPQIIEGSVQCGTDEDGHPAYVARVAFNYDLLPASYIPERGVACGSHGCRSYTLTQDVEVLVLNNCDHSWVPGQNGSYPQQALRTGHSEIGEPTFIGRSIYEGILRLGKVHPSHKLMYLPHRDLEVSTDTYEVLVLPDAPFEWVPMDLEPGAPTDAYLPPDGAIQCGTDDDGDPTYVARVYIEDELLPASYVPQKKAVIASWSCQSRRLTDEVEVLVLRDCDYKWVAGEAGSFPEDALKSGYGDTQEVTYTGRGLYKGIQRLGKVHPSHKVLYMAHNNLEVNTSTYEVLVVT
ncbi:hypothetical protein KR074_004514, partial [Drosophila pseudoananassae]